MYSSTTTGSTTSKIRIAAACDLALLRTRYYNPNIGQFTSFDEFEGSASDPITLHKYLYGNGDPVNNIDPTGHFASATDVSVSVGLMLLIAGTGIGIAGLAVRNPSLGLAPPGAVLPVSYPRLEVHYHSIRLRGGYGADAVFRDMQRFSELDLGPVTASGNITGIGGVVSFDMRSLFNEAGQGDFDVKVTKFDPAQRFFVVRTLSGHPLAGWRYWGVRELPNRDILVETFSVEHPATAADSSKLYFGGLTAMYGTWTHMLEDIVRRSGGDEVIAYDSIVQGQRLDDVFPYYQKVED